MLMEVVHTGGDLDCPVNRQSRRERVVYVSQEVVQSAVGAKFHHHTEVWWVGTRPSAHPQNKNNTIIIN